MLSNDMLWFWLFFGVLELVGAVALFLTWRGDLD